MSEPFCYQVDPLGIVTALLDWGARIESEDFVSVFFFLASFSLLEGWNSSPSFGL
jgi:hypothetical protein